MSTIAIDRYNMDRRLTDLVDCVDDVDTVLGRTPGVADGGIASAAIALVTSAAAESVGLAADATRALAAIADDVLDDLSLTEQQVTEALQDLERQVETR
jgi:hypothetical protein